MTPPPPPRFHELLSTRARIGTGTSVPPARPVANALYEFGGGFPDPVSFPYHRLVEAPGRVMKGGGAQALPFGEPQGFKGLRELGCHKYGLFGGLKIAPDNLIISNGSGHALSPAFSAFGAGGDAISRRPPP